LAQSFSWWSRSKLFFKAVSNCGKGIVHLARTSEIWIAICGELFLGWSTFPVTTLSFPVIHLDTMSSSMSGQISPSTAPRIFPNTRWSVVLAAKQRTSAESTAALEAICHAYWYPLYAYVRRCGQTPHDAQDLTQGFFCRLLEKNWLNSAEREKGKLRTFLIVALKNFMSKEWRRASAQRRGGGQAHAPFDTTFAESRFAADGQSLAPDETFDRQWALTLLDLTVNRLQAEFLAAANPGGFEVLKGCLMAGRGAVDYAAIAKQLSVNEGAARVAVHRLRKRFREIYREEISQTLTRDENLDAELQHLATALARR
jgi:DNA-directed RNA polymerase specialized sigma24 family protein